MNFFRRVRDLLAEPAKNKRRHQQLMTAIENLNAAVGRLQTTADEIIAIHNAPNPTDAQIQSAADSLNQQVDRIRGAFELDKPQA